MKVGIIQSNYIPWRGYFDIIDKVDLFVFHDDLQYTKDDWRNRNRILTDSGPQWLTIPCGKSEKRLICEVELSDTSWQSKHWNMLMQHYRAAPGFGQYSEFFESVYKKRGWSNLSDLNQFLITEISRSFLGVKTEFLDSRELGLTLRKGERVIEILEKVGAKSYLSGPSAKGYLESSMFADRGIALEWMDYPEYMPYPQRFEGFEGFVGDVSIVDLLLNLGDDAVTVAFQSA